MSTADVGCAVGVVWVKVSGSKPFSNGVSEGGREEADWATLSVPERARARKGAGTDEGFEHKLRRVARRLAAMTNERELSR